MSIVVAAARSSSSTSTSTSTKKPSAPSLPTLKLPSLSFPTLPTFYSKAKVTEAKDKLLELIAESERGTKATPSRSQIEAAIDALYSVAPRSSLFPTESQISGKWRLVWTSEREVLWLIENSKRIFGANIGEVFQTLELSENAKPQLKNEVVFPPGGLFLVNSSAKSRSEEDQEKKNTIGTRVDFKFSAARLDVAKVVDEATGEFVPRFSLPLPPFGQGWFDTVVVDEVRIARDVRGDTLICVREIE